MNIKTTSFIVFIYIILSSIACKQKEVKEFKNNSLLGVADVWCDESLKFIVQQEEEAFEHLYKYAQINVHYGSEQEIMKAFYKDSIDAMIVSASIDTNDLKKFNQKKIFPRQYKFATSAIAFITSKENNLDSISKEALFALFKSDSKQKFVVENTSSGIAKTMLKEIGLEKFNGNVFAKNSNSEVIAWLTANPKDIGLIDWSEVSDSDDANGQALLRQVKLIAVSNKKEDPLHYQPLQYNLAGSYPFTRDLYFIRRTGNTDVNLGFASFVCGEIGQKVLLKAGLLPNYQTERWIEFKGLTDIKVVE